MKGAVLRARIRSRATHLTAGTLLALACISLVPDVSNAQVWQVSRAYAFGRVYSSGANWNAARVNMEVRSGSVSAADIGNGGFIAEVLWVGDANAVSWVELGYSRGWAGYDYLTPYWACNTTADNYYEHAVVNITVTPGTAPKFRISKHSGVNNAWDCAIGGVAANDIEGDNTANSCIGNNFNSFDAGMESSCTSGEIATTSNYVDITNMEKATDGGTDYSYGPGLTPLHIEDPVSYTHGSWVTVGRASHHYRQH